MSSTEGPSSQALGSDGLPGSVPWHFTFETVGAAGRSRGSRPRAGSRRA